MNGEAVSAGVLQSRAVKGSLWTVVHVLTSIPLAFVANAVVARSLGVEGYGDLAVLTLALTIAVPLTNAGVSEGVMQWGAAANAVGNVAQVETLLRKSLGYHLLIQMPLLVTTVVVLSHGSGLLVVGAMALSVIMPAALGSAALSNTIENKSAGAAKIAMVTNAVTQATIAVVAYVSHSPAGVWAVRSFSTSLLLPLNFMLLDKRRRRIALSPAWPRRFPDGFWRFSLLTAASGLIGLMVFSRSELLILDAIGSGTAAGLFALAFGLSQQVTGPIDALLGPLNPAVAGIVEAHPERAPETLLRSVRVAGLLGAGVCALAFPPIVAAIPIVYGDEYTGASAAFLALGISSCLQSVINPLLTFNRARRRSDILLKIYLAALVIDVGLAFALIPSQGLWGAVIANLSGQVTVLAMLSVIECRAWSIPAKPMFAAITPLALACASVTSLHLSPIGAHWSTPVAVLTKVLIGVSTTVVLIRVLRVTIPTDDLEPVFRALPSQLAKTARWLSHPVISNSRL